MEAVSSTTIGRWSGTRLLLARTFEKGKAGTRLLLLHQGSLFETLLSCRVVDHTVTFERHYLDDYDCPVLLPIRKSKVKNVSKRITIIYP